MFKILIFSSFFSFSDSLPQNTVLFESLRSYHNSVISANVAEYSIVEKKKWLNWIPQIGLGFNLLTDKIRPTVSYSFSQIHKNLNDKEALKQKIITIQRIGELNFKTDSLQLVSLLKKAEALQRSMVHIEAVLVIQNELFEQQRKRFDEGLILPTSWLALQVEHAKISEPYYLKLEEIDLLVLEIFRLARM